MSIYFGFLGFRATTARSETHGNMSFRYQDLLHRSIVAVQQLVCIHQCGRFPTCLMRYSNVHLVLVICVASHTWVGIFNYLAIRSSYEWFPRAPMIGSHSFLGGNV